MNPTLHTRWKRKNGAFEAEVSLHLPIRKSDIRHAERREGRQFKFWGYVMRCAYRPKNRLVPFSKGSDVGLGVEYATLELRWTQTGGSEWSWYCSYDLVVPVIEGGLIRAQLGGTRVGGERSPIRTDEAGMISVDTPFRDGAHALWDAEALGVKAFAVYDGNRTELKASPNTREAK